MRSTVVSLLVLAASLGTVNSVNAAQTPTAAKSSAPASTKPASPSAAAQPAWITRSNQYTEMLLNVQWKHSPESASAQGLSKYDSAITDVSRANEVAQRKELEDVLTTLKKTASKEKDKDVRQDLDTIQKAFALRFREDDYQFSHKVQFVDATQVVFSGLRTLLDDQVADSRHPAAVIRLRKYAGVEPGFKPIAEILKQRLIDQMAKPEAVYPSTIEIEATLGQDKSYIDAIHQLLAKYKLTGWQNSYDKLNEQLAEYDTWIRSTILPKARPDFRLSPDEYALNLERYGVDLPPDQLATQAHAAFTEAQTQMAALAAEVAKQHGWTTTDYRDVIRELKKTRIIGDDILPFYEKRLKAIEEIITTKDLVTLPSRPVTVRLATSPETVQAPTPHMVPPPFLHNTGQHGEFVVPLIFPSGVTSAPDRFDDFTFDAIAWPMSAHEARPGNDLEFDSIVNHGVSGARVLYGFNTTTVDAWGLYAEWLMQPYEPADGQLITLQMRLLRAARAFLDPELQSGKITADDADKLLEKDVVLSHAFANEEIERYTYRAPGQATSYFYAYTKLLDLRKDAEAALGPKFNAKQFNNFVLAQGPLTPDLMRKTVLQSFVPAQKKKK